MYLLAIVAFDLELRPYISDLLLHPVRFLLVTEGFTVLESFTGVQYEMAGVRPHSRNPYVVLAAEFAVKLLNCVVRVVTRLPVYAPVPAPRTSLSCH